MTDIPPAVQNPKMRARLLAALYIAQEQYGWLSQEAIQRVAGQLHLTPGRVNTVSRSAKACLVTWRAVRSQSLTISPGG
jgi:hypothetical protein